VNKIRILKTFATKEQANTATKYFVEDHNEDYCQINTKRGCVELPNTVLYFAVMSEQRHLELAYGAQYEYIDFHEGIDIQLKRYLQTRIRGVRYD
jgi:hypothetical protein